MEEKRVQPQKWNEQDFLQVLEEHHGTWAREKAVEVVAWSRQFSDDGPHFSKRVTGIDAINWFLTRPHILDLVFITPPENKAYFYFSFFDLNKVEPFKNNEQKQQDVREALLSVHGLHAYKSTRDPSSSPQTYRIPLEELRHPATMQMLFEHCKSVIHQISDPDFQRYCTCQPKTQPKK